MVIDQCVEGRGLRINNKFQNICGEYFTWGIVLRQFPRPKTLFRDPPFKCNSQPTVTLPHVRVKCSRVWKVIGLTSVKQNFALKLLLVVTDSLSSRAPSFPPCVGLVIAVLFTVYVLRRTKVCYVCWSFFLLDVEHEGWRYPANKQSTFVNAYLHYFLL